MRRAWEEGKEEGGGGRIEEGEGMIRGRRKGRKKRRRGVISIFIFSLRLTHKNDAVFSITMSK